MAESLASNGRAGSAVVVGRVAVPILPSGVCDGEGFGGCATAADAVLCLRRYNCPLPAPPALSEAGFAFKRTTTSLGQRLVVTFCTGIGVQPDRLLDWLLPKGRTVLESFMQST